MSSIKIRPLMADDAAAAARIFFSAVHEGTREHYSDTQRAAWGGQEIDADGWRQQLDGMTGFVAEQDGEPVGFMTIDAGGYIDLAFVQPSVAGTGVGHRLYQAVEAKARDLGALSLWTAASKAAKAFFERQGFAVEQEQTVERDGVALTNYRMRKLL